LPEASRQLRAGLREAGLREAGLREAELREAGLTVAELVSVEGPAFLLAGLAERLADPATRAVVLDTARAPRAGPGAARRRPAPARYRSPAAVRLHKGDGRRGG